MALFSPFKSRKKINSRQRASDPLLSASTQAFIANRVTDIYGAILSFIGIFLVLALYSYNPEDPSLNTSTTNEEVANFMGHKGAYIADIMLQTLGAASFFIAFAFAVWGYRVFARREFKNLLFKIALLAAAALFASVTCARIPAFDSWTIGSYLGGSAGSIILTNLSNIARPLLGGNAFTFTACITSFLFIITYFPALGISLQGWKKALIYTKNLIILVTLLALKAIAEFKLWHKEHTEYKYKFDKKNNKLQKAEEPKVVEEEEKKEKTSFIEAIKEKKKPVVEQTAKKKVKETRQKELAFENTEDNMTIPSIDLLDEHTSTEEKIDESSLQKNAETLQFYIKRFRYKGRYNENQPRPCNYSIRNGTCAWY